MNIEKIADALKPWMQVETWNTNHPLDEERFHKALKSAINANETALSYDEIKEAMELLVEELYPDEYDASFIEEKIEQFSSKAETITSYIYDTNKT